MTGGEDADTFVFSAGDNADIITDFDADADVIRLVGETSATVTNDGSDTRIEYGSDVITLEAVALSQGDITIDFL